MNRNEPFPNDRPGGPKPWSEQARRSWKIWRNYYPSPAYARGDPRTFYVPIDRAAQMAGLSRRNFYKRYLMSERLPYEVQTWFHGRKMRRKSFIPRSALLEALTKDLCSAAKRQYVRRSRGTMADLEWELDERRKAEAPLLRVPSARK